MPPKKKSSGGGGDDEVDLDAALVDNYKRACKALNIDVNNDLMAVLDPAEEREGQMAQVCTDAHLGPSGVRALVAGLLAQGEGMQQAPYTPLKSLRLWRNNAGDAGVAAVAHMLKMGPPPPDIPVPPAPKAKGKGKKKKGKQKGPTGPPPIPVQLIPLTHVEFMDNNVGPEGCHSLADALMLGANSSLLTLRLDINPAIGDYGIAELCKGLRTNRTLTKLCVSYCDIGPEGARHLAKVLSTPTSALKSLDLMGNKIGSEGLKELANALVYNSKLEELYLADNQIGGDPDDSVNIEAMEALGNVCQAATSALKSIDLEMNNITVDHANKLIPYLTKENKKVEMFKVDASLPEDIYDSLLRTGAAKKGKGKGKKGGKKKKK